MSKKRNKTPQGTWLGGSGTGSLCLGNRKARSQEVDKDRSRLPGRGTIGNVRRRRRRWAKGASDRTKEKIHKFWVRFRRERRAYRLPYFSLGFGNDRRGMSGRDEASHLSRPPGLRLAYDTAERNEKLAAFSAREVKRAEAEEKERDDYSSAEEQWKSK